MRALEADIIKNPDFYISERAESFKVSPSCIFYALRRLGYSRKKTLEHPKANKEKRADFRPKIEHYEREGRSIVYLVAPEKASFPGRLFFNTNPLL